MNVLEAYRGRKVVVTGGGGFIASHLVEQLLQRKADVTALVHYNSRNHWGWVEQIDPALRARLKVVTGDITDSKCCRLLLAEQEIIFHLAALIAIPYSYAAPFHYLRTNAEGTANLLQAALDEKIARFVHTSTSEVYGTALQCPISESHPLQAQSPYAASKIAADKLVESFNLSFGLPTVTIRPFNTYGPRQSARAVIPALLIQILSGRREIDVGSLEPRRDFNFVHDTVKGFLLAGLSDEAVGRTVNIGSGAEFSIGELVEAIRRVTGAAFTIRQSAERLRPEKSEVLRLCADISLARTLLDYSPEYPLDAGLALTSDWLRVNLAGYKPDLYNT